MTLADDTQSTSLCCVDIRAWQTSARCWLLIANDVKLLTSLRGKWSVVHSSGHVPGHWRVRAFIPCHSCGLFTQLLNSCRGQSVKRVDFGLQALWRTPISTGRLYYTDTNVNGIAPCLGQGQGMPLHWLPSTSLSQIQCRMVGIAESSRKLFV